MWMQDDLRGLRGQVLVDAATQGSAQAVEEAAPADVVRRRQHVELRDGGRKGLGVLGFSLDHLDVTEKAVDAYKRAVANAEPVGAFVNDNLLVAGGVTFIAEDRDQARRDALAGRSTTTSARSSGTTTRSPGPRASRRGRR